MKRDKRDAVFSELVRERVNWTCESCGKYYPEGQRMGLHCSHYVGRAHKATRWEPANAFAHCFGCHAKFEGNPGLFYRWYVERMGPYTEQAIVEKGRTITRWRTPDLEAIHRHLKAELKRMKDLRANGETGRIDFAGWE